MAARMLAALVFSLSSILSASLIFLIEPMFARMVLPRFGGSASVWSVAMVFFQASMLAGYLYAHLLTRRLPVRHAALVHLGLLVAGALLLPPAVAQGLAGAGEVASLFSVMVLSLGLPFVALAANAPLLQAWFLRSGLPGADNPWPLYAASNAGSLGALLAYPLLIEPAWGLSRQAVLWSMAYGALLLLIGLAGYMARHGAAGGSVTQNRTPVPAIARWILVAAIPSAGLVAVTAHLSTDVAAAPFLWVMPLALYLLTFVIVFGPLVKVAQRSANLLLLPMLLLLAALIGFSVRIGLGADVIIHLAGFFVLALACHARLATSRPEPALLTGFYLALSFGGVIGGVLAALVAPAVFSFVAEYPLVILAGTLALPHHRLLAAGAVAGVLVAGAVLPPGAASRQSLRSFYGVHTIETTRDGAFRTLRHGLEVHGAQRLPLTQGKPVPLAYYHEDGPISEAIDAMRDRKGGGALRIGIVGLGTGAIACLAEPGDTLAFHEIDPVVVRIARDTTKFTFLSSCAPKAQVVMGDARQTLSASTATFDLLIVDAFSSDAIPVHLLTREALEIYTRRTAPDGVVLLHISNNHLRLNETVAATAASAGLITRLFDEPESTTHEERFIYQPTVAALARKAEHFGPLAQSDDWTEMPAGSASAWTDDRASILPALRAKWRER